MVAIPTCLSGCLPPGRPLQIPTFFPRGFEKWGVEEMAAFLRHIVAAAAAHTPGKCMRLPPAGFCCCRGMHGGRCGRRPGTAPPASLWLCCCAAAKGRDEVAAPQVAPRTATGASKAQQAPVPVPAQQSAAEAAASTAAFFKAAAAAGNGLGGGASTTPSASAPAIPAPGAFTSAGFTGFSWATSAGPGFTFGSGGNEESGAGEARGGAEASGNGAQDSAGAGTDGLTRAAATRLCLEMRAERERQASAAAAAAAGGGFGPADAGPSLAELMEAARANAAEDEELERRQAAMEVELLTLKSALAEKGVRKKEWRNRRKGIHLASWPRKWCGLGRAHGVAWLGCALQPGACAPLPLLPVPPVATSGPHPSAPLCHTTSTCVPHMPTHAPMQLRMGEAISANQFLKVCVYWEGHVAAALRAKDLAT